MCYVQILATVKVIFHDWNNYGKPVLLHFHESVNIHSSISITPGKYQAVAILMQQVGTVKYIRPVEVGCPWCFIFKSYHFIIYYTDSTITNCRLILHITIARPLTILKLNGDICRFILCNIESFKRPCIAAVQRILRRFIVVWFWAGQHSYSRNCKKNELVHQRFLIPDPFTK